MGAKKVIGVAKPRLIFISSTAPINSKWSDYTALNFALDSGKKDLVDILLKGNCRVNGEFNVPSETPLHKAVKLGDKEIIAKLLSMGASVSAVDQEGNTALHLAFILEQTEIVKSLLTFICKQKLYKNLKSGSGLSYLHIACTQADQTITQSFLKSGANVQDAIKVDSPYWPGFTAMHFAIKFKLEQTAHTLIEFCKKNAAEKLNDSLIINYIFHQMNNKDEHGLCKELTNFHTACLKDNPELLERYIEFGAPLNLPLSDKVTLCPLYLPLHFAVEGNCLRNVEVLLELGARPDLRNSLRMTPLHLAFYHQYDEIVDLLWKALKDDLVVNRKDYYLLSYLHMAVAKNEMEVVKKFCDDGEDLNVLVLRNSENFTGYAPLHFAVKYRHLEMAEFLIDRGADVDLGSPVHLAVEAGDKAFVDLLLRRGAKVDDSVRNEVGQTVVHALVSRNDLEMHDYVEKFVALGCDVNAVDSDGNTALHPACTKNSRDSLFVKTLLDLGADVDVENDKGWTPLLEALWRGKKFCGFLEILVCHVRKLKAVGVKISEKNEKNYEVALKSKLYDSKLTEVDRQIEDEIERMKVVKLSGCMPLLEFLLLEPSLASIYVEDETLNLIVGDEGLMGKYPMYGYLIRLQFERGTKYLNRWKRSDSVEILEEVAPKRKRCE